METFSVTKVSGLLILCERVNGRHERLRYICCMNEAPEQPKGLRLNKLLPYFFQGLLVIAPIAITIWAVYSIISFIDNQVPIFTDTSKPGEFHVRNYGLGFLIVIVVIIAVGYLSSFLIKNRIFNLFDSVMKRTPGVRLIYSTTKEFFEAFAGEKKKFNKPVLACVDGDDVWRVGFITQQHAKEFGLADHVAVYIPMSYSIAGNVYLLPPHKIKAVTNVNATDAMKFAISGGVTAVEN